MAQQVINFGTPPSGTDGDTTRTALGKLQANDTELYAGMASAQATANCGLTASFKNKLINGNFDVWQRGTAFATPLNYTADRWQWQGQNLVGGNVSQGVFTPGDAGALAAEATNYLSIGNTGNNDAVNHYSNLIQRIEGVRTLAGKTATLSFRAFNAGAPRNISIEFRQTFGTGGSAQLTGIGLQLVNIATGWSTYSVTVNIPSIAGKTVGANDWLGIVFWLTAGTANNALSGGLGAQTGSIIFSAVQVEAGSTATPFEKRPVGVEIFLAQRFFRTGEVSWQFGMPAAVQYVNQRWPVQMRAAPALVVANYLDNDGAGTSSVTSLSANSSGLVSLTLNASPTKTNARFYFTYTADAEL